MENEFDGLTVEAVDLMALEAVRERMLHELPRALSARQSEFLLSMAAPPLTGPPAASAHRAHAGPVVKLLNLEKLRSSGKRFAP